MLGKTATAASLFGGELAEMADVIAGPCAGGDGQPCPTVAADAKMFYREFCYAEDQHGVYAKPWPYAIPVCLPSGQPPVNNSRCINGPRANPWLYHYFTDTPEADHAMESRGAVWYVMRIAEAFHSKNVTKAMLHLGCFAHGMGDRSSPYHAYGGFDDVKAAVEAAHNLTAICEAHKSEMPPSQRGRCEILFWSGQCKPKLECRSPLLFLFFFVLKWHHDLRCALHPSTDRCRVQIMCRIQNKGYRADPINPSTETSQRLHWPDAPWLPTETFQRLHWPEMPRLSTETSQRQHCPEMPRLPTETSQRLHWPEMPRLPTETSQRQHCPEMPRLPTETSQRQHWPEMPRLVTKHVNPHFMFKGSYNPHYDSIYDSIFQPPSRVQRDSVRLGTRRLCSAPRPSRPANHTLWQCIKMAQRLGSRWLCPRQI